MDREVHYLLSENEWSSISEKLREEFGYNCEFKEGTLYILSGDLNIIGTGIPGKSQREPPRVITRNPALQSALEDIFTTNDVVRV